MTTISLIMVRFSILNHRWKAQNVGYHVSPLVLAPAVFIRENTVCNRVYVILLITGVFQVDIHKDMLKAQLKAGDEERQQISAELHERISKIDKLRKRWVTISLITLSLMLDIHITDVTSVLYST